MFFFVEKIFDSKKTMIIEAKRMLRIAIARLVIELFTKKNFRKVSMQDLSLNFAELRKIQIKI